MLVFLYKQKNKLLNNESLNNRSTSQESIHLYLEITQIDIQPTYYM